MIIGHITIAIISINTDTIIIVMITIITIVCISITIIIIMIMCDTFIASISISSIHSGVTIVVSIMIIISARTRLGFKNVVGRCARASYQRPASRGALNGGVSTSH